MLRVARRARMLLVSIMLVAGAVAVPTSVAADTSASRPIWPSIALDGNGKVHIAYDNANGLGIIYATNKSGSWVKRRVTSGNDSVPHLTVDSLGRIRIIFTRTFVDSPRRIYYATNRTGVWATKRLPWNGPGSKIHFAVSPKGTIHVVFGTEDAAWYVTNAGGTWVKQRLDAHFGQSPVLAVDRSGAVHLAFNQCLNDAEEEGSCEGEGLYYRTNASGAWVQSRITEFQGDRATGIVTDGAGAAHMVFQRPYLVQGREELGIGMFYLTNASGAWVRSKVATPGVNGRLGVDLNGAAHIVYNQDLPDNSKPGIYFATNKTGSWVRSTAVRESAMYPEMVLDRRGVTRLAFMRMAIDPGVYYAHNRAGTWARLELMD